MGGNFTYYEVNNSQDYRYYSSID